MTDGKTISKGTVLVAEDDSPIRMLISVVLKRAGYNVLLTTNGLEAERVIRDESVAIDLLLTDISMPGMDGIELARIARNIRPVLKIVFASGSLNVLPEAPVGIPVLPKPFTFDELLAAVERRLSAEIHDEFVIA